MGWLSILAALLVPSPGLETPVGEYLGAEVCGQCHEEIYQSQSQSRMARTWRPAKTWLEQSPPRQVQEGPLSYKITGEPENLFFQVSHSSEDALAVPIESLTGGERFGIGFLLRVEKLDGLRLLRPALLEARYMHSVEKGKLILSPGHSRFQPTNLQSSLGRVLNPSFEDRCLTCHGSPRHTESRMSGIHCERCHGPGGPHLEALDEGSEGLGITNPARAGHRAVVELCSTCHSGFSELVDPRPQDLLISDQARALSLSECFVQSDAGFSCISCHDPHEDARHQDPRYDRTCLSCHEADASKAGVCPVNSTQGCVDCHMPVEKQQDLHLLDHWIRVVPGRAPADYEPNRASPRSRIPPKRLFLRILVVRDRSLAESLRVRIQQGESFHELARQHSIDATAELGGFLGPLWKERMSRQLAEVALKLNPGDISRVFASGNEWALLQRCPRDFRTQATELEEKGAQLQQQGKPQQAIPLLRQALEVNPYLLRGHHTLALTLASTGKPQEAVPLLERAQRLFPDDPTAPSMLARLYAALGRRTEERQALQRALRLNPNQTGAHLQMGSRLYAEQDFTRALEHFEAAARINPLSAVANYNLGKTLEKLGRPQEARRFLALAQKLQGETPPQSQR